MLPLALKGVTMQPEQIKQLSEYKKLIVQGNRKFQTRKDRNYIDDLSEIGLTVEEAWIQILSLNKNNYFLILNLMIEVTKIH